MTVSSVILVGSIAMVGIVISQLIRLLFNTRNYLVVTPLSGLLCGSIIIFSLMITIRCSVGPISFAPILSAPVFIFLILRKGDNKND